MMKFLCCSERMVVVAVTNGKKAVLLSAVVCLSLAFFAFESQATVNFSDNFSYPNGNLTNGVNWFQTAAAANPVQVNNGTVVLGTSGQDVYSALSTPISITDGSTFYIGATLNFSAAQSAGDYFLHWTSPAGTTTTFQERLYAKSSGAGFIFGYNGTSGAANYPVATVLNFNTTYRVVLAYTAVAGAVNDTFALYVDPTDTSVEGNNTAYMTSGYVGAGAEVTTVSAINLRQGTAANASALTVDDLVVGTTFVDVSTFPVPEPSSMALAALGGFSALGFSFFKRRK